MKLLNEAVEFFTSNPGFSRLLKGMLRKYRSLGRWGGSVTLTSLKEEEKEALSTFFRQDYSRQQSATISLERFAQALTGTRYGELSILTLMEKIQGKPLRSNAEILAQKEQAKKDFFAEVSRLYTDSYSKIWLGAIQEKHPGTRLVHQLYEKAPEVLFQEIVLVLNALRELAERPSHELYRLPVFARRITKDPHGFDANTERGHLLINALRLLSQEANPEDSPEKLSPASPAEELTELYYSFGLLRDDLWNFVTCTGIQATSEEGYPHRYLSEAHREGVVLNLPLREVVKLAKVSGGSNGENTIFVVENSGVFSALLDHWEEFCQQNSPKEQNIPKAKKRANPPLICTHGQFKLAGLLLLEKLTAGGATLFYSGDFDPEGLLMIDRLLKRCPGQVIAWHYGLEDYRVSLSEHGLSPSRLKKLEGVTAPELIRVKEEILHTGLAGYQEGILEQLWKDVKAYMTQCHNSPQCGI